ncbi:LuxR C-terminal-related transcriptional regulator [Foetidibacter luteolus]|uniref:LuxR C-terminal-related transcriptional regulator n=1 Tax=Foetidibacter luteolus TaxID=2608880 RepID=UPI00129C0987|nr:response regulator transcription factor [Foetidibacter luteolus]
MILLGIVSDDSVLIQTIKKMVQANPGYGISFVLQNFDPGNSNESEDNFADVVIIDKEQEEMDALYTLKHFKRRINPVFITAISTDSNASLLLKLIKAGTSGFITKPLAEETLYNCLNNIANKKSYIDEAKLLQIFTLLQKEEHSYANIVLSKREFDIIKLITRGLTNKEIGEKLNISHHTVNEHLKKIYRKFDVNSRGRLIHKFITINPGK